jgi:hypothetical protein
MSNELNAIPADTRWLLAYCCVCDVTLGYWSVLNSGITHLQCPGCKKWMCVGSEAVAKLKGTVKAVGAKRETSENAEHYCKARRSRR